MLGKVLDRAWFASCAAIAICGLAEVYPWFVLVPAWCMFWLFTAVAVCYGPNQRGGAALAGFTALGVYQLWLHPLFAFMGQPTWDHLRALVWNKGTLLVVLVYLAGVCASQWSELETERRARRVRLEMAGSGPEGG